CHRPLALLCVLRANDDVTAVPLVPPRPRIRGRPEEDVTLGAGHSESGSERERSHEGLTVPCLTRLLVKRDHRRPHGLRVSVDRDAAVREREVGAIVVCGLGHAAELKLTLMQCTVLERFTD